MDSLVKSEINQHEELKSKEQELDSVTDMLKYLSFEPVTNTGYMLEVCQLLVSHLPFSHLFVIVTRIKKICKFDMTRLSERVDLIL